MYPSQLKLLLSNGGISPDNVRSALQICEDWFLQEPGLASFVFRAIFFELSESWKDPQGIPTAEYEKYRDGLLPELETLLGSLPTLSSDDVVVSLTNLLLSYRDCVRP
jgi:hypothetical protein